MTNLNASQFGSMGHESLPVHVSHDPATDNATVDRMSKRIVQTYLAADPKAHDLGEKFYSHDANGAARSIANGQDPNSHLGKFDRSIPAVESRGPGTQHPDWGVSHAANNDYSVHAEGHRDRLHNAAGTIARLSPQTEWETNVRQAHEAHNMGNATQAMSNLQNGTRDTSRKPNAKGEYPRMEVRNDAGEKMDLNKQPTDTILKAVSIARGESRPEDHVASGPDTRVKIGSFMNNVEHPETSPHTTVDFRAHDIASGKLYSTGTNREVSKTGKPPAEGKAPSKAYEQGTRYRMLEEAHNRATDYVNENHPDLRHQAAPLQPKQMQAVTWWADKNHQDERLGGVANGGHLHAGEGGSAMKRESLGKPIGQE